MNLVSVHCWGHSKATQFQLSMATMARSVSTVVRVFSLSWCPCLCPWEPITGTGAPFLRPHRRSPDSQSCLGLSTCLAGELHRCRICPVFGGQHQLKICLCFRAAVGNVWPLAYIRPWKSFELVLSRHAQVNEIQSVCSRQICKLIILYGLQ